MNRRDFLLGLAAAAQAPPNILLIMPDQWRGMDLGSAGNRQVRTPNLDRLAREGVQFENAVANTPVCTPARGTLLTGKYPHTTSTAVNDVRLPFHEVTLPKILTRRGYHTGFIGKWHLDGGIRLPGFVPPGDRRQGFEFRAANECSHDYLHQSYFRDDAKPIAMKRYETFEWTDLALEFLAVAQGRKQPYCLYLQYGPPHDPYLVPPGYDGRYDPSKIELRKNWMPGAKRFGTARDIAAYYAAIECLDTEIGRILNRVDDNTIVFFTSDHGDMLGSHGTFLKRKPWEESVRVPGIVRWPRGFAGGRKSAAPFSHLDVVPTLLGLCGGNTPVPMHGFDYSALLRRQSEEAPEFAYIMNYGKTELDEFPQWRGLRSRKWKYARHEDRRWMLYDLEADPYEMNNLATDARYGDLMNGFDRVIAQRMRSTGDRWDELIDAPYR